MCPTPSKIGHIRIEASGDVIPWKMKHCWSNGEDLSLWNSVNHHYDIRLPSSNSHTEVISLIHQLVRICIHHLKLHTHQMFRGEVDMGPSRFFSLQSEAITRGHPYKISKPLAVGHVTR